MKLEKAEELNDHKIKQNVFQTDPDALTALKLGKEALTRIIEARACGRLRSQLLLPSETKSDKGGDTMNRCLNDCFSYCSGKPDAHVEETDVCYLTLGGKFYSQKTLITMCRINPRDCEYLVSQSHLDEQIKEWNTH